MTVTEEQIKDMVYDCLVEELQDIVDSCQGAITKINEFRENEKRMQL